MKHLLVASLMMLAPVAVAAQEREAGVAKEGWFSDRLALTRGRAAGTVPRLLLRDAPVAAAQATPAVVQRRRRTNSMVGYVDDPTVGTKVRLRFEAAFRDSFPDRAEYFYAKCGCYRDLPENHSARDPLAPGPRPGIPSHVDFQHLFLAAEYGLNEHTSAFFEVPFRWVLPQQFTTPERFDAAAGLGDLRVGMKIELISEAERVLTTQVRLYLATGEPTTGLGTNHNSLEPALLYYQQITDRLVLEAQGGIWLPFGGSAGLPADDPSAADRKFAGNILYFGIGPSYEVYRTEQLQIAPVVELLNWRVLGGFQTVPPRPAGEPPSSVKPDATGTNIVNLKLGARAVFGPGSLYIGYGTALTPASWYEDIIRVEYRYVF